MGGQPSIENFSESSNSKDKERYAGLLRNLTSDLEILSSVAEEIRGLYTEEAFGQGILSASLNLHLSRKEDELIKPSCKATELIISLTKQFFVLRHIAYTIRCDAKRMGLSRNFRDHALVFEQIILNTYPELYFVNNAMKLNISKEHEMMDNGSVDEYVNKVLDSHGISPGFISVYKGIVLIEECCTGLNMFHNTLKEFQELKRRSNSPCRFKKSI